MRKPSVLVIDDKIEMASAIVEYLNSNGFNAESAGGGVAGLEKFATKPSDAVLTDLRMAGRDGMDVLEGIKRLDAQTPVVIMTAFGAVESAVEAIRRGAFHYVTKPFQLDLVKTLLGRACEERWLKSENTRLRRELSSRSSFGTIVGQSPSMLKLYTLIERISGVDSPALLLGETGTGKELVGRAIHQQGARSAMPFVAVNCAALPETLLESELFGHTKGAFTGATQLRRGLFLEAQGGTLLLDEIGDMPLALQAKLLRVLESNEIRPVGSDVSRHCDVRIVAATHRNLGELVAAGKFREDLYYRLNVVVARLVPLRERRDDIPILAEHFLLEIRERSPHVIATSFAPAAVDLLIAHNWPGNVRELRHLVHGLAIAGSGPEISFEDVSGTLANSPTQHPMDRARIRMLTLRELEDDYIAWVLERTDGNKGKAADILGVDPSTLYRRGTKGKGSPSP